MIAAKGRRFPLSSKERTRHVRWVVGLAIAFEAFLIVVGVQTLVRAGRPDLVVCLAALAVGLHFFPMARWLPAPKYYATGLGLLIAAAVGTVLTAGALRIVLVAGSVAAILWFTALAIILSLPRSDPQRV